MIRPLILIAATGLVAACGGLRPGTELPQGIVIHGASASETVPAWAADMIWYQIFPERFANGDPSNDPPRESLPHPDQIPGSWTQTEWTSDWYARADWEREKSDDHFRTVRDRRYGGDLQGVINRLDYIQRLGVTGIYFNPLFWARSEHKYDGNTYHHIDPYFGPDPEGDFALMATETSDPATWKTTAADALFFEMLGAAHERGLRVIIDGVFNHSGRDFFAFQDLYERQQESAYTDWYTVLAWDDPSTQENEFDWAGWWNVKALPEFADNAAGTDLHPGPKAYVFDATAKWMDPNGDGDPSDGVDGWRLDVVADVPTPFWADWNRHVKSINPDAYTVAELWEEAAETVADGRFSALMNYYGFAFPTKGFLVDGRMPASDFVSALAERLQSHRPEVGYASQNLIDSHDTDRVASMVVNAGRDLPYQREDWKIWWDFDWGATNSANAADYLIREPSTNERSIQRLIALFQMTYVGAPMIYYGTEAGMWSADDPDDRQPMWWPEMAFESVTTHPATGPVDPIEVGFDQDVYDFYREVLGLRRAYNALRRGALEFISADAEAQTVVFTRSHEEEQLLVAINRSDRPQSISLDVTWLSLGQGEGLYPIFSTGVEAVVSSENGTVTLTLQPLTGVVLERTGIE